MEKLSGKTWYKSWLSRIHHATYTRASISPVWYFIHSLQISTLYDITPPPPFSLLSIPSLYFCPFGKFRTFWILARDPQTCHHIWFVRCKLLHTNQIIYRNEELTKTRLPFFRQVMCSFLQVYQEKVYDLLNPRFIVDLPVREHPKKGMYNRFAVQRKPY